MKKLLKLIAIIFSCMVMAVAVWVIYKKHFDLTLDESSKKYVDDIVPTIVSRWSPDDVMKYASSQLRRTIDKEQLEQLLLKSSQLGSLKKYEGSEGQSNVSVTEQYGTVVSAIYFAKAKFEYGDAEIVIRIIQNKGDWKILDFYINSPTLLR